MSKAFNIATNLGAYQSAFDSSGNINVPMYSNHDTVSDVIVVANTNSFMPGPVSANSAIVNGHLIVTDSLTVSSGNLTISGKLRIL